MTNGDAFLQRLIAARRAAWLVFLIAVGLQMFIYLAFLVMEGGGMDALIESGLYGNISRDEAARLMLLYVAALKLMNTAIFLGALFLTLWVREYRRTG